MEKTNRKIKVLKYDYEKVNLNSKNIDLKTVKLNKKGNKYNNNNININKSEEDIMIYIKKGNRA